MKLINFSFLNKSSIFIILAIILLFYIACYNFSYNFFYQDDFHLLRFVTIFSDDSIDFQQKLFALYDQHNEHRIIFPRLLVLMDFYLQGHLDWKVLNVFSALYYLGIFIFFAILIKKINLANWFIVPVALFIFQPSAYQNFYWTISILQQVGNLFWAMFLFYSLVYFQGKNFWISLILIFVLTFTHGNGLFAFGVGGIILVLQKRYKHLLIWVSFMCVVAIAYFYGYFTAQNSNIKGSLSDPIRLIGCFGGFWGGFSYDFFNKENRTSFAILSGLLIFIILLIFNFELTINQFYSKSKHRLQKYFPQENLFLYACFLYLTITAGLVALSRSWNSIEAGFQNRYLHNSVIAFVLLYVTILHYKSTFIRQLAGLFMLLGSIFFNIFAWYSTYGLLDFQRKSQEADAVNYQLNHVSVVNDKSFNQNIATVLEKSYKRGISIFQNSNLLTSTKKIKFIKSEQQVDYQIDIQRDSLLEFNISNSRYRDIYQINNYTLPYEGDVYLIMMSKNNTFINPTSHRKNAKISFLKTGQYFTDGFMTTIMTDAMPPCEYRIGFLQSVNNQFVYFPTKYKILTR